MKLKIFWSLILAVSATNDCDKCVGADKAWRIRHDKSEVVLDCVEAGDCYEGSWSNNGTTVCFRKSCSGNMPPSTVSYNWVTIGTFKEDECDTTLGLTDCIKTRKCSYIKRAGDGSYGCEFRALGQYVMFDLVCARSNSGKNKVTVDLSMETLHKANQFPLVPREPKELQATASCSDCVEKEGYCWQVELDWSRKETATFFPRKRASCEKTIRCEEKSSYDKSTICFAQQCSNMKDMGGIHWSDGDDQFYEKCKPNSSLEVCTGDPDCALFKESFSDKLYCSFAHFIPYISSELVCHNKETWDI